MADMTSKREMMSMMDKKMKEMKSQDMTKKHKNMMGKVSKSNQNSNSRKSK